MRTISDKKPSFIIMTALVNFLLLLTLSRNDPSYAFIQLPNTHCHLQGFSISSPFNPIQAQPITYLFASEDDVQENEAERLKAQAEKLREQIRNMEQGLPESRRQRPIPPKPSESTSKSTTPKSLLSNKRVLVVGANGRLGSMVCRELLRQYPEIKEVIACTHVVSESSSTSRGYGRLSYEVGAEDGIGNIGAAWSEERTASFQFNTETMSEYNLQKLRIVECELLDPIQCQSIVDDSQADVVVWCATDFNGNKPRAISGLNVAFLFRAIADPKKGRVEVEGLQNMLGAIKTQRQETIQRNRVLGSGTSTGTTTSSSVAIKPVDILLVSIAPDALDDFDTPFGTFYDQKKQGEEMIVKDFPSLSYTTIQFGKFEDNFVDEDLELNFQPVSAAEEEADADTNKRPKGRRRINRRDAARAVAEALTRSDLQGQKVQVWTDEMR